MKPKPLLTILGMCTLAGAFMLSTNTLADEIKVPEDSGKVYEIKVNRPIINLRTSPELEKVGQTLTVFGSCYYNLGTDEIDKKVEKIILYEDGKELDRDEERGYDWLNTSDTVEHKEPGKHTYLVELLLQDGTSRKIQKVVEFTGKILDLPLDKVDISVNKNQLVLDALDIADNAGVKTIELYKNEKLWKTINVDEHTRWYYEKIPLNLERGCGTDTLFAIFTDQGGHKSTTKSITINYK